MGIKSEEDLAVYVANTEYEAEMRSICEEVNKGLDMNEEKRKKIIEKLKETEKKFLKANSVQPGVKKYEAFVKPVAKPEK